MRRFWRFYFLRVILVLVALELVYFAWLQYRNRKPEVVNDTATVSERHSVKVDILRNDTDKDEDDTIRIAQVDKPMHGKFVRVGERSIEYTPAKGFVGIDSFQYTVNDGKDDSKPGYIKIMVEENLAPVANSDEFKIFPWSSATMAVMINDREREGDTMFVKNFDQPLYGKVHLENTNLVYTPKETGVEVDSFAYTLSDGFKESEKAYVIVSIKQAKNSKFSSVPYYGDLKNYEILDATKWDIINDAGNPVIAINTSSYDGFSGDRPGCYNIIRDRYFTGNLDISARVKCTDNLESNSAADYAIYFAFIDYSNYCYASFSSHAEGDGFTGLYKIVGGQRENVISKGHAFTDNKYHNVKVTRRGKEVKVIVDGKEMCRATDDVFDIKGKVGIGSFNDMANFDDINVIGKFSSK